MNNRKLFTIIVFIILFVYVIGVTIAGKNFDNEAKNMGSFTFDRASSYDDKYYAVSAKKEGDDSITVSIYESKNDTPVFSFETVRASDFWGICWESSSYNIWIQSGDIGVVCYSYENNQWKLNENAKRPDDIISKYDE